MANKPEIKPVNKATTKAKFKSDAFQAIHTSASALLKIGAINKATMRSFDDNCLAVPVDIQPQQIKKLRELNHVSQPIFARYLNTSESTVQKWETGAKRPSGMALKLLAVVQKHGLVVLA
jgi:putative transcriptional regulator